MIKKFVSFLARSHRGGRALGVRDVRLQKSDFKEIFELLYGMFNDSGCREVTREILRYLAKRLDFLRDAENQFGLAKDSN